MLRRAIPWGFILGLLAILFFAVLLFAAFTYSVFRFFPFPSSAADFGQAISGISAPFTALAFAGALYAVFLQRKALELQQQQMTKEIGEVREQTKLLADQFQQIVPIGGAYDRMEATEKFTGELLDAAKRNIQETIKGFPDAEYGTFLQQCLDAFLAAAKTFLETGAEMETVAMARGLARGGRVKARLKWTNMREEIARQLSEWQAGIAKAAAKERS